MTKSILQTAKEELTKLSVKAVWLLFVGILPSILLYFYLKGVEVTSDPRYVKYSLIGLATLSGITILCLTYAWRMYRIYGRYQESFGVLWDKNFNMRCMSCKKPLKESSDRPEIFFCSKCNNKHVLRDDTGSFLIKKQAIELLASNCTSFTPITEKMIELGPLKWKVSIYIDGNFFVHDLPYCVKHDLKFISTDNSRFCPLHSFNQCTKPMDDYEFHTVYEATKSFIEQDIRNKKI